MLSVSASESWLGLVDLGLASISYRPSQPCSYGKDWRCQMGREEFQRRAKWLITKQNDGLLVVVMMSIAKEDEETDRRLSRGEAGSPSNPLA